MQVKDIIYIIDSKLQNSNLNKESHGFVKQYLEDVKYDIINLACNEMEVKID